MIFHHQGEIATALIAVHYRRVHQHLNQINLINVEPNSSNWLGRHPKCLELDNQMFS